MSVRADRFHKPTMYFKWLCVMVLPKNIKSCIVYEFPNLYLKYTEIEGEQEGNIMWG